MRGDHSKGARITRFEDVVPVLKPRFGPEMGYYMLGIVQAKNRSNNAGTCDQTDWPDGFVEYRGYDLAVQRSGCQSRI